MKYSLSLHWKTGGVNWMNLGALLQTDDSDEVYDTLALMSSETPPMPVIQHAVEKFIDGGETGTYEVRLFLSNSCVGSVTWPPKAVDPIIHDFFDTDWKKHDFVVTVVVPRAWGDNPEEWDWNMLIASNFAEFYPTWEDDDDD
jgi:hypothetical protein